MRELYKLTATEVIDGLVDEVLGVHEGLTRQTAKKLVLNALIYNCVIEEIIGQVNFLMGIEDEE